MDKGAAVEYDTPENLFKQGGIFYSMCEKSNIGIEDIKVSLQPADDHTSAHLTPVAVEQQATSLR